MVKVYSLYTFQFVFGNSDQYAIREQGEGAMGDPVQSFAIGYQEHHHHHQPNQS